MRFTLMAVAVLLVLALFVPSVFAEGAGAEWNDLCQEVNRLYAARDYVRATEIATKALEVARSRVDPAHPDVATSLGNLALLYDARKEYAQAEPLHKRALMIREKAFGQKHLMVAASLNGLAVHYHNQERYADAEALYKRALAIRETAYGPDHTKVAAILSNLGILCYKQGRFAEAQLFYDRALAVNEKALGRNHLTVATNLDNLATLSRRLNQNERAKSLSTRARAIRYNAKLEAGAAPRADEAVGSQGADAVDSSGAQTEGADGGEIMPPDDLDVAGDLAHQASLYLYQGLHAQAEPLYKRALAIYEQALGPEHAQVAHVVLSLGDLHREEGRYSLAGPLYLRAMVIYEKTLGSESLIVAICLTNLARLSNAQGRHAEAGSFLSRASAIWEIGGVGDEISAKISRGEVSNEDLTWQEGAYIAYLRALHNAEEGARGAFAAASATPKARRTTPEPANQRRTPRPTYSPQEATQRATPSGSQRKSGEVGPSQHGAGLTQQYSLANWPLSQSVIDGEIGQVKTLLARNWSQDELDHALIAAAGTGKTNVAALLIAYGASPRRRVGTAGHSAVIGAVRGGFPETLRVLLKGGGDANGPDPVGWRPLHHAVGPDYEWPEAIRLLVQYGAAVDGRDGLQRTTLHRAASFGHAESVRVLLALGADASLREKYGNSATERAATAGHFDVARMIQGPSVWKGQNLAKARNTATPQRSRVASPAPMTTRPPSNATSNPNDRGRTPSQQVTTDSGQREPGEVFVSILINWLFGLFPSMFLRYLVLRRPMEQRAAGWTTVGIGVFLFFSVVSFAHVAGVRPNMAAVFIWTVISNGILRAGKRENQGAVPVATGVSAQSSAPLVSEQSQRPLTPHEAKEGTPVRIHVRPPKQSTLDLSLVEANTMLHNGELDGDEPAWTPGLDEWTVLRMIKGVVMPKPPPLPGEQPQHSPSPPLPQERVEQSASVPRLDTFYDRPKNVGAPVPEDTRSEAAYGRLRSASETANSPVEPAASAPATVGGWLLFYCVGLVILSPLATFGRMVSDWEEAKPVFDVYPFFKTAVIVECMGLTALVLAGFLVGLLIWSGNPSGREFAKTYMLSRLFGLMGLEIIVLFLVRDLPADAMLSVTGEVAAAVVVQCVWFTIWWLYFLKSKRVQALYGDNGSLLTPERSVKSSAAAPPTLTSESVRDTRKGGQGNSARSETADAERRMGWQGERLPTLSGDDGRLGRDSIVLDQEGQTLADAEAWQGMRSFRLHLSGNSPAMAIGLGLGLLIVGLAMLLLLFSEM